MPNQDWTPAIGLRKATLSLIWRTAAAGIIWIAALWAFHAMLGGLGITRVPMLISVGFAAIAGSIAGVVIARGLDEQAGFVSPLLTLLAGLFAAIAIIGGEAMLARSFPATGHMRFIIVGTAMIVASVWIAKYTLLDA